MITWKPAVYTSSGLTITVPELPDLKNSLILAVGSAWCTGDINPNPMPYINSIGFSRNSVNFTAIAQQQENGIAGETSRLSLASACAYQANPTPGTYNISIAINAENDTAYGLAGAMAIFVYNAEYSTYITDYSAGFEYSSASISWSTPPPRGSIFIGSCVAGDGGYSGDVIYPSASGGGAGESVDLGNGTYGQSGVYGGGDTLQNSFTWSGDAQYAAAGICAVSKGVIPRIF